MSDRLADGGEVVACELDEHLAVKDSPFEFALAGLTPCAGGGSCRVKAYREGTAEPPIARRRDCLTLMTYSYTTAASAAVADERTTLEIFLDHHRALVSSKVRGMSDDQASRRLVSSATTLSGLLKHLRRVEASWFQHRLAQQPIEEIPVLQEYRAGGADADFDVQPSDTVEQLLKAYEEQCEISRRTAARYDLDYVVPHPDHTQVSLRWIYVHMIEETARHLGHADILREQLDGARGD